MIEDLNKTLTYAISDDERSSMSFLYSDTWKGVKTEWLLGATVDVSQISREEGMNEDHLADLIEYLVDQLENLQYTLDRTCTEVQKSKEFVNEAWYMLEKIEIALGVRDSD